MYSFSEAGLASYFGIFEGSNALAINYQFIDTITTRRTFVCIHYLPLTANVAYTFSGKYYLVESSGTATIYEENYERMIKPVCDACKHEHLEQCLGLNNCNIPTEIMYKVME